MKDRQPESMGYTAKGNTDCCRVFSVLWFEPQVAPVHSSHDYKRQHHATALTEEDNITVTGKVVKPAPYNGRNVLQTASSKI